MVLKFCNRGGDDRRGVNARCPDVRPGLKGDQEVLAQAFSASFLLLCSIDGSTVTARL
jgi:hypothetical protein